VIAAVSSVSTVSAANITGKITLKGTPPPEKTIDALKADPGCGKTRTDTPKTRLYMVGAGGELADTVVYIKEGLASKGGAAPEKEAVLDQKGCEYVPYVLAMQAGQKLVIKNSDPVLHNINVSSKAGNPTFNEAQMGKGPDKVKVLTKPEMFLPFACNVHPWMFAYVSVFDHPYFAVTQKDGTFTLNNVPPGKYTIEAWHRKAGKITKEVTVADANVTADLTLELKQ
jgi:hypothetical protein